MSKSPFIFSSLSLLLLWSLFGSLLPIEPLHAEDKVEQLAGDRQPLNRVSNGKIIVFTQKIGGNRYVTKRILQRRKAPAKVNQGAVLMPEFAQDPPPARRERNVTPSVSEVPTGAISADTRGELVQPTRRQSSEVRRKRREVPLRRKAPVLLSRDVPLTPSERASSVIQDSQKQSTPEKQVAEVKQSGDDQQISSGGSVQGLGELISFVRKSPPKELAAKPAQRVIQPPKLATKPAERVIESPELATKPAEPAVQSPELATRPAERAVQSPELATKPAERAVQSPELATKPAERVIQSPELATKPAERAIESADRTASLAPASSETSRRLPAARPAKTSSLALAKIAVLPSAALLSSVRQSAVGTKPAGKPESGRGLALNDIAYLASRAVSNPVRYLPPRERVLGVDAAFKPQQNQSTPSQKFPRFEVATQESWSALPAKEQDRGIAKPVVGDEERAKDSVTLAAASGIESGEHLNKPAYFVEGFRPTHTKRMVRYRTNARPGSVIIETKDRRLYYILRKGYALEFKIAVGREGKDWTGIEKVSAKKKWPSWRPTKGMRKKDPRLPKVVKGGKRNPLGSRAIYLGNTLYRIHGTNKPSSIGRAASSGCFRMLNPDVEELYELIRLGSKVYVY